jgi:tetratricopeptide (TPR) repeat protein
VLINRGFLSRVLGRLDESVEFYQQANALDPLRATSQLSLGFTLYTAGRNKEAQAAFEKALEINPQAGVVHGDLSMALLASRRPQQALIEAERELLNGPD